MEPMLGEPGAQQEWKDSGFNSESVLAKMAEAYRVVGREETDVSVEGRHQDEQLRQQHLSEQRRLNLEQLDQLKSFKTQLMQDVLSHLSPRSGPRENRVGAPTYMTCDQKPPTLQYETSELQPLSLSLGEAGQLLHRPLFAPHACSSTEDQTHILATPTRPTVTAESSVSSPLTSPQPQAYSISTSPTRPHTLSPALRNPDNLANPAQSSTVHCQSHSQVVDCSPLPPSSTPSLTVSMRTPQPSFSHSSSPTAITKPSTHTHTPESTLLPENTADSFQPPTSPASSDHQKSVLQTHHHPLPNSALTPPTQYQRGSLHTASYCSTPPRPVTSSVTHSLLPQSFDTANTQLMAKTALIEKHARHVDDLKQYYESQLSELRKSITEKVSMQTPSSSPDQRHPTRLQNPVVHAAMQRDGVHLPALPVANKADDRLQNDNERLKAKCAQLESNLEQLKIVNRALEEQVEKQQQYWLEWQRQAESSSQTISVLQDRLEATRTQLQEQDGIVEQVQADLQVSVGEIQFWKEQQTQEADKFKQLCRDFRELQEKNDSLEATQHSLREELSAARREVGRMDAAIRTHVSQEQDFKSTIHKLEDRIRRLEHVNNRLHSQATHNTLGNTPDDDKLQRHSRSPSPTPSHPPLNHTSPLTPTPRRAITSDTTPSTHPHSHPHTLANSSMSLPLSRRKWLQSSDPGLILGTPPLPDSPAPSRPSHYSKSTTAPSQPSHTQSTHSSSHGRHTHHHTSNITSSEMTSSPLLQSTGQTIVQRLSDSGSSNEGEDPASLTRHGYINRDIVGNNETEYDRSVGKDGDSSLVNSTLSAIHSGRIKTLPDVAGQPAKHQKKSLQERVKHSLRVVAEAEERLAELRKEKEKLESVLQRVPREGGRVTKHSKQAQLETERRLEAVVGEIGSVRMTLRNHHALRK